MVEIVIWVALAVTVIVYRYVCLAMSQPPFNRPQIFWSKNRVIIGLIFPQVSFALIILFGFWVTNHGWWILGACVLSWIMFSKQLRFD